MKTYPRTITNLLCGSLVAMIVIAVGQANGQAQGQSSTARQFVPGEVKSPAQLPQGRFRNELEGLPSLTQRKALKKLQEMQFPVTDVESLHVDASGGICYGCVFGHQQEQVEGPITPTSEKSLPQLEQAAVPISPFPDSLKFHSRPGSTKRLYINFVGQTVTGTAWNTSLGRTSIVALPFSTDTDYANFSDSEQQAIKRVWQRMAEDYAPFDIDVTTEAPATITNSTAIALITRNTDANDDPNPSTDAGGVAYVGVFGASNYISTYSPAWIYQNNLGNTESYIAEAASHEIGHNLGLSHDGTSTLGYYEGHFTSDTNTDQISWGPLMGTGYYRNVSQWSKGEYPDANNTQDDLAIIAGKIAYRPDDHGNTPGTARPLVIIGNTTISSTTPENDPDNAAIANKGILERNTDVDVFSFTTGAGTIQLNVNPWIQPAGTRGGNLDILLELHNQAGTVVATNNPATATTSSISTSIATAGTYYLYVKNSGAGDPLASPPTGYTSYASIGQYYISGTVVDPGTFVIEPVAEAQLSNLSTSGQSVHTFTVTYTDNLAINVATLGTGDVRVTGPNGYDQLATFVSVDIATNGTPRSATYSITPAAGGNWLAAQNGTYIVSMVANEVQDTENAYVAASILGQFDVALPIVLYSANMSTDPGWTLDSPQWSYGQPNYGSNGPTAGYSGTNVIGHSMSSNYAKSLSLSYATSPTITNASQATSLTLSFRRWLGLKRFDTAILQVSGNNGSSWTNLWSATISSVSDTSWQLMQYVLPQSVIGSSQIKFRWGLSSLSSQGNSPTAIGWHIDDVELLGGGVVDASPPAASLSVANISDASSPTHSCTVNYTDATAVLRSSVDVTDLVIVGPAGSASPLAIDSVGVDLAGNGSPLSATYSIIAPDGTWDAADNGIYTITLQDAAVADTVGNATPLTSLGNFTVNISALTPGVLAVTPGDDLVASGIVGGSFTSSSLQYTLTNSGQQSINWSVSNSASWVTLSATGGTLAGGANTTVTVSIGSDANSLTAGSYSDSVSFSNLTNNNGNATRNVSLTVNTPGTLAVTPAGNFSSSGTYGGTFSPSSLVYTLQNTGSTSINWTVAKTATWLSLSSTSGTLAAGASIDVTASIHNSASTLNAATYNDTITFTNTTNNIGNTTRSATLIVISLYTAWTGETFTNALENNNVNSDPDGDGWTNFLEYAFGTDPTLGTISPLAYQLNGNVTNPGSPMVQNFATVPSPDFRAVFGRRKNYLAAGLNYFVQFSADMQTWTNSEMTPTLLTGAENTADVEAVSVPFPASVPTDSGDRTPTFFRVKVVMP